MPLLIVRNDITEMHVDAIVNTANHLPMVGSGVDKAIYTKAGWEELLNLRKEIGKIEVGNVAVTPALNLNAKYIFHAVGPRWKGGSQNEAQLLEKCFANILKTATKNRCKSVAIPLISTGNFGFPKQLALQIANAVITQYLAKRSLLVYLVVFDREAYCISAERFRDVESYVDEKYVGEVARDEYAHRTYNRPYDEIEYLKKIDFLEYNNLLMYGESASVKKSLRSFEDIVVNLESSFSEALLKYIDEKGLKDPQVYKRANLDRKLFSKIRKNKNYKPSKNTALALAIALELNLDETKDFIGKAGYAFTHSSKMDIIVEHFILKEEYDIFRINEVLFKFEQPLLGLNVA